VFRTKYMELIREGLDRIETTVSKLLWMARKAEHAPADINIKKVVESIHSFVEYRLKKGRISFASDMPDDLRITVDLHDFQQLLLNLFINAIQAMEDDGGLLAVKGYRDNSSVKIEVMDDGCGIPQENIGKIFDPFFTTKPTGEGTGLGLWLSYEIMRSYGGEIYIESREGEGSRFTLSFPMDQPA
ncbi:MAG: ATP-binding protein, partial [Deltaproteobacteria bacterium]|nr:ATP-binding protein [Deltaproteobacteria bacterium]